MLVDNGLEGAVWAGSLQIGGAAEPGRCLPGIDCYGLSAPSLQLPDVGNRHSDASEHGGTRFGNLEACREYRIATPEAHRARLGPLQPTEGLTNAHHLFECRCHRAILHGKAVIVP